MIFLFDFCFYPKMNHFTGIPVIGQLRFTEYEPGIVASIISLPSPLVGCFDYRRLGTR